MNPQGVATYPPACETRATDDTLSSITISSRIPEFWADQPRLWFVQFEAAIESQKLTDAAKQNLVVTKLSKTAIQQVSDLILSPPESRKYGTLKDRLLQVFEESETRQFQKLLGEMELGTQKPSQLLRRMRDLARGKMPDQTLQIMWNSHLPSAVQAVLAVTEVKDLEHLAVVADKVIEASRPSEVAAVASHSRGTDSSTTDLIAMMNKLSADVAELRRSQRPHGDVSRGRRHDRSSSRTRYTSQNRKNPEWLCFYHYRYRDKAAKCVKPCNWRQAKQASVAEN